MFQLSKNFLDWDKNLCVPLEKILPDMKYKFRLYDGDGELYYEGFSDHVNFEPLDWAQVYAGCTSIWYYNLRKHQWEEL